MDNNLIDYREEMAFMVNPRKRKCVTPPPLVNNNNNDKRPKSNEELFKLIFGNDPEDIGFDVNEEIEEPCPNPLCDHIESVDEVIVEDRPIVVTDIMDLIELGKTYHCKNRKIYFGINLRLLCNLVVPLTELSKLVGMQSVKENIVNQIVFFLQGLNQKERCGNCIDCSYDLPCPVNLNDDMLHTVITGPPGVGKTELGKILGKVYKAMGILSNGTFHIAKRSDLIGKFLGHTAAKTQAFINKCAGGVMFIDEAYSLGNKEQRDSFSKECIDTINQNLTERRDFLCIIAGYRKELNECFFSYNPGLERRFTFRYNIDGYDSKELMEIFILKVKNEGWNIEFDPNNRSQEERKLFDFFRMKMDYFPHFGGDVETFFLSCKIHHGRRVLFKNERHRKVLNMEDIENGFNSYLSNRKLKNDPAKHGEMMYLK